MPLDFSYGQPYNPPAFFASVNAWTFHTNSKTGQHSLYMFSEGLLRVQIVPLDNDTVSKLETAVQPQLLTINSHFFNIKTCLCPYLGACDRIEISTGEHSAFSAESHMPDIDWKFIKNG